MPTVALVATATDAPNPGPVPDVETNAAIREIASTPTDQHLIPAEIVALLYRHVDEMGDTFFAGVLPQVVLSFDVQNRRNRSLQPT